MIRRLLIAVPVTLAAALIAGGVYRGAARVLSPVAGSPAIPTTTIRRGDLTRTVSAKGELQGGNSEMLTAPMTGGIDMALTTLCDSGEVVNAGDVVAQFDTTEQGYKLKEAEADLAERLE